MEPTTHARACDPRDLPRADRIPRSRRGARAAAILFLAGAGAACSAEGLASRLTPLEVRTWSPAAATEPASASTQERDPDAGYRAGFYARDGYYVGARYLQSRLGGDFDGNTVLSGPDTIVVPD